MTSRRDFGSVRKLPSGRYQAAYWHDGVPYTAGTGTRSPPRRTQAHGSAW